MIEGTYLTLLSIVHVINDVQQKHVTANWYKLIFSDTDEDISDVGKVQTSNIFYH